jgi:elongation factor Ts
VVTTDDIKRLREETGAGVMDSKRALEEANGDFERAKKIVREQGIAAAAKRAERETSQGLVEAYIHGVGRIGALVEVQCETDFVARTDTFKQLARDVAMQVAAMNPLAISPEDVPDDHVGKREDHALLTQSFIRDPGLTINDLVQSAIGQTGENIRVARFSRFELGTG